MYIYTWCVRCADLSVEREVEALRPCSLGVCPVTGLLRDGWTHTERNMNTSVRYIVPLTDLEVGEPSRKAGR